ncbi:unnamed protein product [Oncorhynchus mykiss]|uniref:EGF-like domain-containing protein n=1 Tax=Oncorhynchus mykiss TaxID=8022 RepID=A0A060XM28_ONCMY|nr:unnamed protein product [Oncorhynchus mykiss]
MKELWIMVVFATVSFPQEDLITSSAIPTTMDIKNPTTDDPITLNTTGLPTTGYPTSIPITSTSLPTTSNTTSITTTPPLVCINGGELQSGVCICPDEWTGDTCSEGTSTHLHYTSPWIYH